MRPAERFKPHVQTSKVQPPISDVRMSHLNLTGLPEQTIDFVRRLTALGINDRSIHGISQRSGDACP